MTALSEIRDAAALQQFLSNNKIVVMTFSAHWCGPCNASKPKLEALAKQAPIPFAIAYEDDLGDELHSYNIRAFPTYICFVGQSEVQRGQRLSSCT